MASKKLSWSRMAGVALPMLALTLGTPGAVVAGSLVLNGNFETSGGAGQINVNTTVADWTVSGTPGYSFLFTPGSADTTGVAGQYGNVQLWGPNNGSANGLPAASPAGGNFIGQDGDFQQGPIQQTITGLVVGDSYAVNFYWAAAQQFGFTGPTTEQWQVSLGSETKSTAVYSNPSHGFSGWIAESFTYTATSTSEVLSFLAVGTPAGLPPFSLLDGVSMNATVPEPSAIVLMGVGLLGVAAVGIRKRVRFAAK